MDRLKKIIFLLFLLCSLWTTIQAELSGKQKDTVFQYDKKIPEEFFVKQRWFSWTLTFDVETKDLKLGTIHRKFWSLRKEYDFYDTNEELQAKAIMRLISLGAIFDVTDNQNTSLGKVKEHFFCIFPTFDIISPDEKVLSNAKLNFWGTKYTLKDPVTLQEMARLTRSFFRLKDNWTVSITDPMLFESKQIDPKLFITVMAFQTDRDLRKRINNIKCSLPNSPKVDVDFEKLRVLLEQPQDCLDQNLPEEEDFETVVSLVDSKLGLIEMDDENDFKRHFEMLCYVLENEDLTPAQRKAAHILLQQEHLNG